MNTRKMRLLILATSALLVHTTNAHAWGPRGHEQVADIAWKLMKPETKAKIKQILIDADPNFIPLAKTESGFRRAFRRAANFPDVIKSNRHTSFESFIASENATFPLPPTTPASQRDLCKTWHYYDTPILVPENVHPLMPPDSQSTALAALPRAISFLDPENHAENHTKSWYLAWVEHIVGDLHQPLHCAESFAKGSGDGGGNLFEVRNPETGRKVTLHSVWDSGIQRAVDQGSGNLSTSVEAVTRRWLKDPMLLPSPSQADNLKIADWIAEGAKTAEVSAYSGAVEGKKPDKNYTDTQVFLCKKQAVLAGTRLAKMLDQALAGN